MSTTLLFVELLIIGVEVTLWMLLLALAVFDLSWLKAAATTGWENVLTVLFLAICYTTGILFDRFADWVFSGASEHLKERIIPNPPEPYVVMRFKAAKGDEYLNRLFEYIRSRMRIARASAINLPLIAVFGLILVATRATSISQSAKLGLFITIPVFGVAFTMLALFSWHRLMSAHLRLVKSSYEGAKLKETPSTGTSHTDE